MLGLAQFQRTPSSFEVEVPLKARYIKSMSIFFRVERFGGEPHLIRVRGLYTVVGEDERGILTCSNPSKQFFSIYMIGERYLLVAQASNITVKSKCLKTAEQTWISNGEAISVGDYRFIVTITSSLAEALAHSKIDYSILESPDNNISSFPHIVVRLSHLSSTFPLFPNVEYTVGSDKQASIFIDLEGVKPRHFLILSKGVDQVLLTPLDGVISADGTIIETSTTLRSDSKIRLEPPGIELTLQLKGGKSSL